MVVPETPPPDARAADAAGAETPEPPLFDLTDPAVRWATTLDGLVIERRFRPRTLVTPVLLVLFGGFGLYGALQDGNPFIVGIVGLALLLWCVYLLMRIRMHQVVRLGRGTLDWTQHWPRRFDGSWPRSELGGVRILYDQRPKWHDRLHVTLVIEHDGRWVCIGTAQTYGFAPGRRRMERLGEALSLALGRPLERLVAVR